MVLITIGAYAFKVTSALREDLPWLQRTKRQCE